MTEDRQRQIEAVISDFEAQGAHWTNQMIYERTGGNYSDLSQYLKERRAQGGPRTVRQHHRTLAEEYATAFQRLNDLEQRKGDLSPQEKVERLVLREDLQDLAPGVEAARKAAAEAFDFDRVDAYAAAVEADIPLTEGLLDTLEAAMRQLHGAFGALVDHLTAGEQRAGTQVAAVREAESPKYDPAAWQTNAAARYGIDLRLLEAALRPDRLAAVRDITPGTRPVNRRYLHQKVAAHHAAVRRVA